MSRENSGPDTESLSLFAAAMAPFAPEQIETRPGTGGKPLSYIDATTATNRLDDVFGPSNWDFAIKPWGDDALIGTLTVRLPDGSVTSKSSVGGKAGMQNHDDDFKSADSDCFKRCCDRLGIGRYLRQSGLPVFVTTALGMSAQDLACVAGGGNRPRDAAPPGRLLPQQDSRDQRPSNPPPGGGRQFNDAECPQSGKGLFAWAKKKEDGGVKDVVKFIDDFGKQMSFSNRMIDWSGEEVREAWDAYHGKA